MSRSVLLAGPTAGAVDGGFHIRAAPHFGARRHHAARRAALGTLGVGVVADVDPREGPAVVAALGEEVGVDVREDSHDQDGLEDQDRRELGALHSC